MKDPIIEKIRKLRQDHANECGNDLKIIYEDLKRLEAICGYKLVRLLPNTLHNLQEHNYVKP